MAKEGGILSRYATVLDAIAASPEGLSFTEVIRSTGLPRGSVHRLLQSLCSVGYLSTRSGRKIYAPGPRLLHLLYTVVPPATVSVVAQPILKSLAERFEETAFLDELRGDTVQLVTLATPMTERQTFVRPGRNMPVHASASARAIWAFQPEDAIEEILTGRREKFTEKTRTRKAEVLADLEQARQQGYAVADEEMDPGVSSYACPIHLGEAGVLYSIGLVGLSHRLRRDAQEDVISALRDAAHEFSDRLPSNIQG